MGCRNSKPDSDVVIIFHEANKVVIKDRRKKGRKHSIVLFLPVIVVTDEYNTQRVIYTPEEQEQDMKKYIFETRRF
ncbi:hypothetical protein TcasGA2_TC034850 [Tribolium castaneum]|uniref:Uncharacterized protein n=1 Tax=Tribolium castaneum TaxID=7070 RepID=A0A139WCT8_TRICA|nr:hypothetical protein TcasGA2_TC034850 [Tribolium castaneum]